MTDPYAVLGVKPEDDDETIRRRYLELVREFPPEKHAQRFAAVRSAYEKVRDLDGRVVYRLFEQGKRDTVEDVIEDVTCRSPRRRLSLEVLAAIVRPVRPLTPDEVERVLADFRTWLTDAATGPAEPAPPAAEAVDLHTLVGQFVALRHEVNLQTKATRQAREQNAEFARRFAESAEAKPPADETGPLVKAVIDVADSLANALRQVERQKDSILEGLDVVLTAADVPEPPAAAVVPPRPGFFARLFGATPASDAAAELRKWRESVVVETRGRAEDVEMALATLDKVLEGLVTGYRMSLQRVDRVLEKVGVVAVATEGEPFDPDTMEAVEVVAAAESIAPGQVVEEVRRGYARHGIPYRPARSKSQSNSCRRSTKRSARSVVAVEGSSDMADVIVGIDLGTTNSEVAIVRDGQPHVFDGGRRPDPARRSSACPKTAGCSSARRPATSGCWPPSAPSSRSSARWART